MKTLLQKRTPAVIAAVLAGVLIGAPASAASETISVTANQHTWEVTASNTTPAVGEKVTFSYKVTANADTGAVGVFGWVRTDQAAFYNLLGAPECTAGDNSTIKSCPQESDGAPADPAKYEFEVKYPTPLSQSQGASFTISFVVRSALEGKSVTVKPIRGSDASITLTVSAPPPPPPPGPTCPPTLIGGLLCHLLGIVVGPIIPPVI